MNTYDPRVSPWQISETDFPAQGPLQEKLRFLIRYAVLAPSSHNTQPWRFAVHGETVQLYVQVERWLEVADPDRRELYISLGCALENLLVAMEHFGLAAEVRYLPSPVSPLLAAEVKAAPSDSVPGVRPPGLFAAITTRCTNHKSYLPEPVLPEVLQRLQSAAAEPGVRLFLTKRRDWIRIVDEMVTRADAILFSDRAFRDELSEWIGRGVFGTPWLLSKLEKLAVQYLNVGGGVAQQDHDLLMSSPVFGVLTSETNDHQTHLRVGQAFERIYLTAAMLGLSIQPMSQIVEAPETRTDLAKLLGIEAGHPQQPFRLGFAEPEKVHTPRLPLEEVLR